MPRLEGTDEVVPTQTDGDRGRTRWREREGQILGEGRTDGGIGRDRWREYDVC